MEGGKGTTRSVRRTQTFRQFPACGYLAGAAATGAEELLEVPLPPPPEGVEPLEDAELEPESEPELELEPESEPPPPELSFLVEL